MRIVTLALILVLVCAVGLLAVSTKVVDKYVLSGQNMDPGLEDGQYLLVNKMAYDYTEPARGEIVSYTDYASGGVRMKRVIGLPGDVIEIKANAVYVNGFKLAEPYVKTPAEIDLPPCQVQPGFYFLLADNRSGGLAAESAETVSRSQILGRAWAVAWPPDRWGEVNHYSQSINFTSSKTP